ncbi:mercury transporter MerT [Siccirubricoccus sp. KC 17139]|uniref:Mercuric transport protein MerT n=1 Tax=Siccirubricoccus soli TaxID=2899147 RepID=A0ABT1D2F4_9PROT|nr:mercuric transporter MerT family protein [Siccirubricoccus soli]MCO6416091.1 mercury transporter MerT [Siccirubricoccus soli]MCP2682223.1 mercuric transporter MerT family protein [Siccirubricoccus soli]
MSDQAERGVLAPGETGERTGDGNSPPKALLATVGLLAALGASSCCLLPLGLFLIGVSGAWIGNLTALAPYQPIFVAVALACLAGGFFAVYRRPRAAACAEGWHCARPASDRTVKIALWSATALVVAALAFPYAASILL